MADPVDQQAFLTERNVALVRVAYQSIGADGVADPDADVWDLISDDIEIRDRPEAPDPQTYHGRKGVQDALESSDETFEEFTLEPTDMIGVGNRHVVVVLRMTGRGRGSGVPVEEEIAHLWTVVDGKAVAMQVYSDQQDALRDARAAAGQE
jgi:ketosteroid isomerase-like protein